MINYEAQQQTVGNICLKLERNLTSSHREMHMIKLFVYICCCISDTVVITQEAQLQTLENIYGMPNLNKIGPVVTEKRT